MTGALAPDAVRELLARRTEANERFFDAEAERIARLCHAMAERFARGGRLLALGVSGQARSDARHVAVEFVHPVIVGKRALPALGARGRGRAARARRWSCWREPDDVAIAFGPETASALATARAAAAASRWRASRVGAEWELRAAGATTRSSRQELAETLYHLLWELCHVFFDHRGLLEGRDARAVHDTGASSFLYPFLGEAEHDLEAVVADVRALGRDEGGARSARSASRRSARPRSRCRGRGALRAGSSAAASCSRSATAAPPRTRWTRWPTSARRRTAGRARRRVDLTEDPAILTAIANDVGVEAIFQRQVIAYGLERRRRCSRCPPAATPPTSSRRWPRRAGAAC